MPPKKTVRWNEGCDDSRTWNRRHEDNRQWLEEQFSKRRSVSKATKSESRFCPRSDAISFRGLCSPRLRVRNLLIDLITVFDAILTSRQTCQDLKSLYVQIYGKSKARLWRNLSTGTPRKFFGTILCFVAVSLQLIFFSEQPFYGNYSTLHSHTNTVISHAFAFSSRCRRKPWQGLFEQLRGLKAV